MIATDAPNVLPNEDEEQEEETEEKSKIDVLILKK
jgi:hypothetical protein